MNVYVHTFIYMYIYLYIYMEHTVIPRAVPISSYLPLCVCDAALARSRDVGAEKGGSSSLRATAAPSHIYIYIYIYVRERPTHGAAGTYFTRAVGICREREREWERFLSLSLSLSQRECGPPVDTR